MARPIVLCATDLSDAADRALLEAHGLAHSRKARLHVILVLPDVPGPRRINPQGHPAYAELPALDAEGFETLRQRVEAVIGNAADAALIVEHGNPEAVILESATSLGAAVVVIGPTGRSTLERTLFGSVADHVVRDSPVPVLVARESPLGGTVIGATDFSETSQRAMEAAAEEARRRGRPLTIVHGSGTSVFPMPPLPGVPPPITMLPASGEATEAVRDRLSALLQELGVEGVPLVLEGDPGTAILELARSDPAQLVVIGHSRSSGLARMLLGSIAQTIVRSAPCSVLVVP